MNLYKKSIPHIYKDTYKDQVDDYLLVYPLLSKEGLTVLNKEAAFLFSQVNNKRSLGDILLVTQKFYLHIRLPDIIRIFNDFVSSEIIYFDHPKSKKEILLKNSDPLDVWLHITNQCNLRCAYCFVSKTEARMSKKIANRAIEKVFLSAKRHGFKIVIFKFAGGEPLQEFPFVLSLNKKINILSNKYDIKADCVVLTNGILITEKIAKTLKENNIRAAVSLDGIEKYHDKTRIFPNGKGTFRLVMKGLNNLLKAKVPFNVMVTITSNNLPGIPDLTKLLLSKNIPFNFNFFRDNPCVKEKLTNNKTKMITQLKKAYQYIYNNPPRYKLANGLLDRVKIKPHLFPCGMGKSFFVIRHDGKLTSCQMTLEKPIGSIEDKDLITSIRNGSFVKPVGLTIESKTPCKTCQWRYVCCGGCPLITYKKRGRYDVNSPDCSIYKTLIPVVLRLEAKRLIKYGHFPSEKIQSKKY